MNPNLLLPAQRGNPVRLLNQALMDPRFAGLLAMMYLCEAFLGAAPGISYPINIAFAKALQTSLYKFCSAPG